MRSKRVGREICSYIILLRVISRNGANEYVGEGIVLVREELLVVIV